MMRLTLLALCLCLAACAVAPTEPAPTLNTPETVVLVRDEPVHGSPLRHTFFQVWNGYEWELFEKKHKEDGGSHVYRTVGWRDKGRKMGSAITGDKARELHAILVKRFNEGDDSYFAGGNNSNRFVSDALDEAKIDKTGYFSAGAVGR